MIQKLLTIIFSGYMFIPAFSYAAERWYTDEQAKAGAGLYASHCAECHKTNAEGTEDWRKTDSNGKYPPPPLNGSAHAWHHSMKVLASTIQNGGLKLGGVMPAFKDQLNTGQTLDIIAFFQSKWDDKIYSAWLERNPLPSTQQLSAKKPPADTASNKEATSDKKAAEIDPRIAHLQKILPGSKIGTPEKTPISGIYQVKVGGKYAYVTEDGSYALVGNLLDLKNGGNLTKQAMARDNVPLLLAFPEKDVIVFKAAGKEKTSISVFSDTSCPYCKKFHRELPELQKAGVTIRYIPFPRGMDSGPGYKEMLSVWCAEDKNLAMNIAMGVAKGKLGSGDCGSDKVLRAGFDLGHRVGVQGTPTSFLVDGTLVRGYVPAAKLIRTLNRKRLLQN